MVSNEVNLTFYAEGKTLIELNECKSRAVVSISNSFNNLGGINSEIRQVRKSNNIIEFQFFGPVYVHVQASSATVAWRKKDELKKLGFGYDDYGSNKIRIDKVESQLQINVFPLKKLSEKPRPVLSEVEYTAFLAEEEVNLYNAMNCFDGTYLSKSYKSNYNEDKNLKIGFEVTHLLI